MGFICNTFGHKWNGCKCARCGEVRNEQHSWRGCTCTLCGKVRDEQHNWNLCLGRCLQCGKMRPPQHLWKGAACIRCGIKRDLKEITDPSVLADIAKNDESEWIRKDAVSRVKDQSILADIAKHDRSERVRKAAVVCVEDQRVLTDIANNKRESAGIRNSAVSKLTDQTMLFTLAKQDRIVSRAAALAITDPDLIRELYDIFCAKGDHLWEKQEGGRDEFNDVYTSYKCKICGKTDTNWLPS